jgi:subtilisin family serine protease
MNAQRWLLFLALLLPPALALADDARVDSTPVGMNTASASLDRQILVTFRSVRSHSRPATYGSVTRRRHGDDPAQAQAERVAREHALEVLDAWPMPSLGVDCFVMQLRDGDDRAQVLQALAQDARVESAEAMQEFRVLASGDPLLATQPVAQPWHLRELHELATGRNVAVASVDTGVLASHPDLRGRLAGLRNFVPGQQFLAEGHGTAVASIIGARADDGIGIAGIAPAARLYALRACWQLAQGGARCSSFSLAQALQYALAEKMRVINLSLTGPRDPLQARLLDAAQREHVAVVAAVDAGSAGGGFPASHPGVIAVAAEGDPARLSYALRAPGQGIPAANAQGGWDLVSGASFAAAQVSGLAALLLEHSPQLQPAALRALISPPASAGRIDACAALAQAGNRSDCAGRAPAAALARLAR